MNQSENDKDNPYKKVFDDAWQKLESSPNFQILKKLGPPEPRELARIPFPYGREAKTKYNFNAP